MKKTGKNAIDFKKLLTKLTHPAFIKKIIFKYSIPPVIRACKIAFTTLTLAQFFSIISILTLDHLRKNRETISQDGYPRLKPDPLQVGDTEITTYMDGNSLYADMLEAIENAKATIYFETFIWKADPVGKAFKSALIRAAQRGVSVYCIWDTFGNLVVPPHFFKFPKHPHLHIANYSLAHTSRDHRKILVVDKHIGFVGGYNIGETYTTKQWRDTHIRMIGPNVWELEEAFVDLWNHITRFNPKKPKLPNQGTKAWNASIVACLNNPQRLLFPIRGMYLDALKRARESVYVTAAYFVPDKLIQQALIDAARRGVDVKVLIPEKSNHLIADWISKAYLTDLLEAGVKLWLYQDVMIHAKTVVVDGAWTSVGTANIDRLSMTGNFEINMSIFNRQMAARMEDIFYTDLINAREMTRYEWNQRSIWRRLVERLLKPLAFFV